MPEAQEWLEKNCQRDYFVTDIGGIPRDIWGFRNDWDKTKDRHQLEGKVYEFVVHFKWYKTATMFKLIYG